MKLALYPEPILRKRVGKVTDFTSQLLENIKSMFRIMEEGGGIGLAGPQAGWGARVFITRIHEPDSEEEGIRRVYVNPEILERKGEEDGEEGCLSFPEISGRVLRPAEVLLRAQDLEGKYFEERAFGLTARCWEHEVDHLDGIVFISRMDEGMLLSIRPQLRELEEKYENKNKLRRGVTRK